MNASLLTAGQGCHRGCHDDPKLHRQVVVDIVRGSNLGRWRDKGRRRSDGDAINIGGKWGLYHQTPPGASKFYDFLGHGGIPCIFLVPLCVK